MSDMLVPELTMYWIGAAVLALVTVWFAGWSFRLDRRVRAYGLAAAAITAFAALGYLLMATETLRIVEDGTRMPLGRFVGYAFLFGISVVVLWATSGAGKRWLALLLGATYLWLGSVIGYWFTAGQTEMVALSTLAIAFVLVIGTMLGPLSTAARDAAGERRLLYGKLRNFIVMVLVLYLVVSVVSDQGVGVLDAFVGVFVVVYLDVVYAVGFGILVLRSEAALLQIDGDHGDDGSTAGADATSGDAPTGGDAGGSDPAGGADDGVTIADPSATTAE